MKTAQFLRLNVPTTFISSSSSSFVLERTESSSKRERVSVICWCILCFVCLFVFPCHPPFFSSNQTSRCLSFVCLLRMQAIFHTNVHLINPLLRGKTVWSCWEFPKGWAVSLLRQILHKVRGGEQRSVVKIQEDLVHAYTIVNMWKSISWPYFMATNQCLLWTSDSLLTMTLS